MNDEIAVSVCCITYNHEKYIRQCMDGFLSQKTTFRYEIIVHDDASTDGTQEILKEYEKSYPSIIRLILQTKNQYSKGVWPERFPFLAARGKYIAMCEGDDYWTDPHKLQKQFDAMEENPNCHLSVHRVEIITEDNQKTGKYIAPVNQKTGILCSKDFLRLICDRYCFHTSSYFTLSSEMQEYILHPPTYTSILEEAGDEKKFLYFGQLGDVFYFDDTMSCRREFSIGSWTSTHRNIDWRKMFIRIRDIGRMMESYDKFTEYRFHDICQKRIDGSLYGQFGILQKQKQYKMMLAPEYKELRKKWSVKYRILVFLGACCPWKKQKAEKE